MDLLHGLRHFFQHFRSVNVLGRKGEQFLTRIAKPFAGDLVYFNKIGWHSVVVVSVYKYRIVTTVEQDAVAFLALAQCFFCLFSLFQFSAQLGGHLVERLGKYTDLITACNLYVLR